MGLQTLKLENWKLEILWAVLESSAWAPNYETGKLDTGDLLGCSIELRLDLQTVKLENWKLVILLAGLESCSLNSKLENWKLDICPVGLERSKL